MLEHFFFMVTGWFLAAVSYTVTNEQIAADEAVLRHAALRTDDESLLDFFQKRTLRDSDRDSVRQLIRQLGSEIYRLREQAMAELIGRGPAVVEPLRTAIKDTDLETARRAGQCVARIQARDIGVEVVAAAARLLAARKPAGAVETMLAYLPFVDKESSAAHEGLTLLALLARPDGQ